MRCPVMRENAKGCADVEGSTERRQIGKRRADVTTCRGESLRAARCFRIMDDMHDFNALDDTPHTSLRKPSKVPIIVGVTALSIAGAVAGYVLMTRAEVGPPEPAPSTSVTIEPIMPTAPQGPVEERQPAATPESASSHPTFRAWLQEDELYSRVVAAVVRIADGESPAALVPFLRPSGAFQVEERNGKLMISDASFARYDAFVDVIDSIDAAKAAAAYRTMKPMLSRIHDNIAPPKATLDSTISRALTHLLSTPTPPRELVVVEGEGITYKYADASLEKQSDAQKHLIRMGARNAERVKAKLRALQAQLAR
jgi:hypothetical protein